MDWNLYKVVLSTKDGKEHHLFFKAPGIKSACAMAREQLQAFGYSEAESDAAKVQRVEVMQ